MLPKMPAPLRVSLSDQERTMLEDLRVAPQVVQRTRDRAHMLLLNGRGWRVSKIADCFSCHPNTVRQTIKRWQKAGLMGLWDAPGRGVKPKWSEADLVYLETRLDEDERTYTSAQLSRLLEQERQVQLSRDRLRRVLKKRGLSGSGRGNRTEGSKTQSSRNSNKRT